jgi:hypothetical protein
LKDVEEPAIGQIALNEIALGKSFCIASPLRRFTLPNSEYQLSAQRHARFEIQFLRNQVHLGLSAEHLKSPEVP